MQRKALEKHTNRFHKGEPVRESGTTSLFEFSQHKNKKRRIQPPTPDPVDTSSETNSDSNGVL